MWKKNLKHILKKSNSCLKKSDCTTLSEIALTNRKLLQDIMKKYGFTVLKSEWWHFDYENVFDYPVLDVSFEELALIG